MSSKLPQDAEICLGVPVAGLAFILVDGHSSFVSILEGLAVENSGIDKISDLNDSRIDPGVCQPHLLHLDYCTNIWQSTRVWRHDCLRDIWHIDQCYLTSLQVYHPDNHCFFSTHTHSGCAYAKLYLLLYSSLEQRSASA